MASRHAADVFFTATLLILDRSLPKRVKILALALATFTAASRVLTRKHAVSDVARGMLIGCTHALIAHGLAQYVFGRSNRTSGEYSH